MISTKEITKMFDLGRQYDVYAPWLKANGYTTEDLPLHAKTEHGEDVIVEATHDENGKIVWKITTVQKNRWYRINYYYDDGTVEELYEH